ncbi:MAG: hypothetical protein IJS04_09870 [Muribaculaceae bacterium]|nr:hypothetical protein [Muribaculaceae bacterium]MBQ7206130.1 hypothetical protein [Muribaculaceae bacterium]
MEHPKFIITSGGHLRLGMVTLHRDLLMPHEDCLGGGFYEFDYASGKMLLGGKSFDYGTPRWGKIDVLRVPEAYRGLTIVYRDSRGDELNLTTAFTIEYY